MINTDLPVVIFMKEQIIENLVLAKKSFFSLPIFKNIFGEFPKKQLNVKEVIIKEESNVKVLRIFPKENIHNNLPKTIESSVDKKFMSIINFGHPNTFVLSLKNASVLFNEGFVVTKEGSLINEVNPNFGRKTSLIFRKLFIPEKIFVNKRLAVLPNSDNYYHWMFEVIPRLLLLKKSRIVVEKYITSFDKKFKRDTLEKLNINSKNVIQLSDSLNIWADELIVPTMPIHTGNPTKEICAFLRKSFIEKPTKEDCKKYSKIYVSRGNVRGRKILNESELIDHLSKKGFVSVNLDNLSISQQSKIFASANTIVAFHGAALTNLIFCKKGTKVVEFFNPEYINVCYWAIANCVGLDYSYFLAENKNSKSFDVFVDINKLDSAINVFLE